MYNTIYHGRRKKSIKELACIGRIRSKKRNQFAFLFHNERGYTFLNLLLSFFIYSIIISTLTIILHFLLSHSQHPEDLRPYEWELFVIQLHKDLKEASNITANKSEITFKNKLGESVRISQYKNLIRRQVDGTGHEIFLLKVKNVEFQQDLLGVQLFVESIAGKNYRHTFRTFKERST
ncbi:competence type IV pilus minor pilin ComGF [Metabacillus sp. FJAT-53654]|uniref:Competence type IV pilus minor pilin ComGF n=1 Tax=Metabacillus rhizosphaerae TaxID=3117747 RepID=A0ABZ2N0C4_9BACI